MNWYLASLLINVEKTGNPATIYQVRRCHCLISAATHDDAYQRALKLGKALAESYVSPGGLRGWAFRGIRDLVMVYEPPEDAAELAWSQVELTADELRNTVRRKEDMRAFRTVQESKRSGWYVAAIVMQEVHDEGSHGERSLVWINWYLLSAETSDTAYAKALRIGKEQEDQPGSHTCDGERAHWEFKGIEDIVPTHDVPGDCALLWCDEFEATGTELDLMAPNKLTLTVFKWEAGRRQQNPHAR